MKTKEKTTRRMVIEINKELLKTYKEAYPEEKLKYSIKDVIENHMKKKIEEKH